MAVDRATFDTVRQHVIETAPPGLTKEQFEKLLDGELSKVNATPPAAATRGMLPPNTVDEPLAGTWVDRGRAGMEWRPTSGVKERNRPDNSLLGVPPELAVVSGVGLGRAIVGGAGPAGKAIAGAKNAAAQATPVIKYEVTKAALEHVGVPSAIAVPVAMAVSGYRRGATGATSVAKTAEAEASVAGRVESGASAPGVPASPAAPVVEPLSPSRPSGSTPSPMSPQRLRNEVGLAARRQNLKLTDQQYAVAEDMVRQGASPMESVKLVHGETAAALTLPKKLKLSAADTKEYMRIRNLGKSDREAMEIVQAQRELAQSLGTPSVEDVRSRVAERNATGRWK